MPVSDAHAVLSPQPSGVTRASTPAMTRAEVRERAFKMCQPYIGHVCRLDIQKSRSIFEEKYVDMLFIISDYQNRPVTPDARALMLNGSHDLL